MHIWAGVFVFLGVGSTQWLVIEHLEKYSFFRIIFGACLNVIMNFFMIPKMGGTGAAVATLISQMTAAYLANYINPKTRPVFFIQTKAILNALRLKPLKFLINKQRKIYELP